MTRNPTPHWTWPVGRLLGALGGLAGVIATLLSTGGQGASALPIITFLVIAFVGAGVGPFLATTATLHRASVVNIVLGLVLIVLSLLAGFSIGLYILPGAILVLLSGLMLRLAARPPLPR